MWAWSGGASSFQSELCINPDILISVVCVWRGEACSSLPHFCTNKHMDTEIPYTHIHTHTLIHTQTHTLLPPPVSKKSSGFYTQCDSPPASVYRPKLLNRV